MDPLSVDRTASTPAAEQVVAQIAGRVADGRLARGERLPTVRALAADLSLAPNTVAKAYRTLEADGVVTTEGRRGTFVTGSAAGGGRAARESAATYAAAARRAGLTRAEAVRLVEQAW